MIVGVLDFYSTLFSGIEVNHAVVAQTEQMKYAGSGEYNQVCQNLKEMCDLCNTSACLGLMQLQKIDEC